MLEENKIKDVEIIKKKPVKKTNALSMKKLLARLEELEKRLEEKEIAKETVEEAPVELAEDTRVVIEKMRLRDRELLVGRFKDYERSNGNLKFTFNKYEKDPLETFLLKDRHRYALPRGVVNHLKESGFYNTKTGMSNINGEGGDKNSFERYSFELDELGVNEDISKISRGYAPKNSR